MRQKKPSKHDQNFKNVIAEYALQALPVLLPDKAATWPPIVEVIPIRQEQLKERLGDSFRELDIPLRVKFRDGSREDIVVVIENESRNRKAFLKYLAIVCVHLSMLAKTNRIIPVAFYPFRKKPFPGKFKLSDGEETFLDFHCRSCVLGTMDARKFEVSRNLFARLLLPLMKRNSKDKLRLVTRAFEGLAEFEPDEGKRKKYSEFIGEYARLSGKEKVIFNRKYVEKSPFKEEIMSLTDYWKEQGKATGKAEGKAEGVVMNTLEMYKDGDISAAKARSRLKALAKRRMAPRAMVNEALKKIAE